ncbi:MAG: hypothetical protein JSV91_10510 [Phycisphaerales bacterium]|nr:MAG: hypothetical protein JSV91_10510 [Phycisphaerales bacterium]
MTADKRKAKLVRSLVVYSVMGLWCLGCLAVGVISLGEPFAPVPFVLAVLCVIVIVLAALNGSHNAAIYGVILLTGAAVMVGGVIDGDWGTILQGMLIQVIAVAAAPIAFALSDLSQGGGITGRESSDDATTLLHQIREHSMLSDSAKRVLFRDRELGLLRQAIESDIAQGAYNAGLALCDEMAEVFGYREDAEVYRTKIMQASADRREQEIAATMAVFEQQLETRDWRAIYEHAARFKRLYPDAYLTHQIEQRIVETRNAHKMDLEQQFIEASQREDIPRAMSLLRQLDRYLSKQEAARLSEMAGQVVAKHRDNLGVQFKLAVSDRRWTEAIRLGDAIIEEFPNTKMADEVRSMLEVLRARAEQTVDSAEVG